MKRLSIIVPSYNQGRFIGATLRSIEEQRLENMECVVVDGCSTDCTHQELRRFGERPWLRVCIEPDEGVVDAVNKGFAMTSGDIVAVQSSDDLYRPNAFNKVVALFQNHPETGLVFGNAANISSEGRLINCYSIPDYSFCRLLARRVWIPQCSAFVSRAAWLAVGGWNEINPYVADMEHYIRVCKSYSVVQTPQLLGEYRVHDSQRDKEGNRIRADWIRMANQFETSGLFSPHEMRALRAGRELIGLRYPEQHSISYRWARLFRAVALYQDSVSADLCWHECVQIPLAAVRRRLSELSRS